ncbi:MAG: heat-inducible transcription repressor HrcA [Anaerolineae bacterium]|nr:heat-inducible transcription repressor HrcA [Anaerolineae bacterium]
MEYLTDRQKVILMLVIHDYVRNAVPVGSDHLVRHYHLDFSPATVRNEMAALTDMGYLRQPHTSAGRVPSEEGYRYFVGRLQEDVDLPDSTRQTISHQFYQTRHDIDQWGRLAASVLAHQSKAASLVTAPLSETVRFKHLELIATHGRQVLMVLVLGGGDVHQRVFALGEPVNQEQLSNVANRLTKMLSANDLDGVRRLAGAQPAGLEQDVLGWVIAIMERSSTPGFGAFYSDGLSNVLAEPEFASPEETRRALRVLEERSLLEELMTHTFANHPNGVQVLIGGEGNWEELKPFSVVLSQYGAPGLATGMLGVLGPMRMAYGRTISAVRFLSALLSDMLSETLGDDAMR